MSSSDKRQRSIAPGLKLPGLVSQYSPVEQVSFPENTLFPGRTTRQLGFDSAPGVTGTLADPESSPGTTRNLPEYTMSPGVTRTLPEINTGTLSFTSTGNTTALRQAVVIRGSGKKKPQTTHQLHQTKGRKWVFSIAAIVLLLMISLGTALAVSPLRSENGNYASPIQLVANLVRNSGSNNPSLIAQQATATAVIRQDGYDPGLGLALPPGGGGLNRFAFGQCTYWANMHYHQLTGYWVQWLGNAYQWLYGAKTAGWIVSTKPIVPSIIVLQPYVQGASGFGHVAIVEKINPDGSVYTSNYNWYANGGWDRLSYWTFTPGSGVSFVWHP